MTVAQQSTHRAGLFPWLPWPLSGMRWWTEPIAAERLAALRIGLALCVLLDLLTGHWSNRELYFGPDGLGTLEDFQWYAQDGKRFWSILRGPGDDLNFTCIVLAAMGLISWLLLDLRARWSIPQRPPGVKWGVVLAWCAASGLAVWGYWIRVLRDDSIDADSPHRQAMWLVPLALVVVAFFFWLAESLLRRRLFVPGEAQSPGRRLLHAWTLVAWVLLPSLVVAGFCLHRVRPWNADHVPAWVLQLVEPWMLSHTLIAGCLISWMAALLFLMIGFQTRVAAVTCWVLSTSFANVNPIIENAGDSIRQILFFYLMLCPCGAVWSVDAWLNRRQRPVDARIVVSPWPVRLIFVQLVLVYFLNGAYKVFASDWRDGATLYYVLHDTTLTRFSFEQLPLDYSMTRWLTWSVLVWELSFPLLVLWKWSRRVALCFGVFFHLGIAVTMDLGFFVPFALCMYLPLLPWEKWGDRGRWRRQTNLASRGC